MKLSRGCRTMRILSVIRTSRRWLLISKSQSWLHPMKLDHFKPKRSLMLKLWLVRISRRLICRRRLRGRTFRRRWCGHSPVRKTPTTHLRLSTSNMFTTLMLPCAWLPALDGMTTHKIRGATVQSTTTATISAVAHLSQVSVKWSVSLGVRQPRPGPTGTTKCITRVIRTAPRLSALQWTRMSARTSAEPTKRHLVSRPTSTSQ